jgi:hypothetical protein
VPFAHRSAYEPAGYCAYPGRQPGGTPGIAPGDVKSLILCRLLMDCVTTMRIVMIYLTF